MVFFYNPRDEVTSAMFGTDSYSYQFDDIGNRVEATSPSLTSGYAANELNQYEYITNAVSSVPSVVQPSYDLDGNMESDGNLTYTWNGENSLVMASNATTLVEYAYDYMGRMSRRTVNGTDSHYLWDGWNMVAEVSGAETNHYVWGLDLSLTPQGAGGVGGLLCSVRSQSGTDPVAHYFAYDAFGNQTASSSTFAAANPWRFSTKYWEAETGLLHYERRPYVPGIGRWLKRDRLEERGGYNLYGINVNNSIDHIDYLGLSASRIPYGRGQSFDIGARKNGEHISRHKDQRTDPF